LHSWVTWSAHLTMQKSDSHNLEIQSGVYGLGCHLVSLFVYCISSALAPTTCHVLRCQDQLLQIVKQIQSLQSFCNSHSMEHTRVCAVFSPTDKTSWWVNMSIINRAMRSKNMKCASCDLASNWLLAAFTVIWRPMFCHCLH